MLEVLLFAAGLFVGGLVAWFLATYRARTSVQRETAALQSQIGACQSTIDETRRQLAERKDEIDGLQKSLQDEQQVRVAAETRLRESFKNIEEQQRLLAEAERKLKDAFAALSAEALRHNSEAFAKQAAEKVRPLSEALNRYENEIKQIEKARQTSYAGLTEQLKVIATTHQQLSQETTSLVHALRTPQVKGRWGELQLRRTVEVAGLLSNCDYIEQYSMDTDDGRQRPDLLVKLPGDRTIVVDSKVSTNAYLDAVGAAEPAEQQEHLARYVRAIRAHVQSLSSKAYWNQFDSAPDFVVMFVPGESFFSAALEQDRALIEDAMRSRVILASPTTLIALLRTVAYSWQQQELLENARQIGQTARYLFERVCKFADHLGRVGDGLRRATDAYNASVASWESRVLPMGRRITELGVAARQAKFAEMKRVQGSPRALPAAEEPQEKESRSSNEAQNPV
jgi:DNA recombination protein RmuC